MSDKAEHPPIPEAFEALGIRPSILRALAAKHPNRVVEARGVGLFAALELTADAQPVVNAALERGLLVNRTATTVVRLLPPYIVTEREVDQALEILDGCL